MPCRTSAPLLFALPLLAACAEPDDVLFIPPPVPPAEIAPGLFRVTWNPAPDVVRGFTPDGARIVYQGRDLPGTDPGWSLLTVGVTDGVVREEARIYRLALTDTVAHVVLGASDRLLVTWRAVVDGQVNCTTCPPPPAAIDFAVRRLPLTDGAPVSALPTRNVPLPNYLVAATTCADGSIDAAGMHRIRVRPADLEIQLRRVNPFGPVELADRSAGFYSDGEVLWRYDPADPAAPPDSVGPGAFPALSPDGLRLAAAVPLGLDSASGQCASGLCPCRQETVTITTTGWAVLLYDLAGGSVAPLASGLEPTFDPLAPRLAVRRPDGLYWVDLASGDAAPIPNSDGGYAPAVAPDGSILAFTAGRFDNPDIFFVRIR
jgi:hypothetical protein